MNDLLVDMAALYLLLFSPLIPPLLGWVAGKVSDMIRERDADH
ncbi:hypothetical protein [Saccharopolyspora erythraea]|nr:hypothetical protein [Saccharopolyspora erythraea]